MPLNDVIYSIIAKDKFSAVARKVAAATNKVGDGFRKAGTKATKMGFTVSAAFGAMKGAARAFMASILPLVAGFAGIAGAIKFVTAGLDFEDQLADLSAITKITGEQLSFLSDESKRLGDISQTTAVEVLESFKLVASSNDELKDTKGALSAVVQEALLLKNATGIDLNQATLLLTRSLNNYSNSTVTAAEFTNILAASQEVGAAEAEDLGQSIIKSGVAASSMKVDFVDLNAAIQTLAKTGNVGAKAGTGIKTVLLAMGTSSKQIRPNLVGLIPALERINELLETPGVDREAALEKLFGREGFTAGVALLENIPLLKRYSKEIREASSAQEQAAIRMSTTRARFSGIAVRIGNVFLEAFERLSPDIDIMIGKFEKFLQELSAEDIDTFANSIAALGAAIIDLINASAKAIAFIRGTPEVRGQAKAATAEGLAGFAGPSNPESFIKGSLLERLLQGGAGAAGAGPTAANGTVDVNVNVNAAKGATADAKVSTSGKGLNAGVQMTGGV